MMLSEALFDLYSIHCQSLSWIGFLLSIVFFVCLYQSKPGIAINIISSMCPTEYVFSIVIITAAQATGSLTCHSHRCQVFSLAPWQQTYGGEVCFNGVPSGGSRTSRWMSLTRGRGQRSEVVWGIPFQFCMLSVWCENLTDKVYCHQLLAVWNSRGGFTWWFMIRMIIKGLGYYVAMHALITFCGSECQHWAASGFLCSSLLIHTNQSMLTHPNISTPSPLPWQWFPPT